MKVRRAVPAGSFTSGRRVAPVPVRACLPEPLERHASAARESPVTSSETVVRARTKPVGPVTPYAAVAAGAQRSTGSAWAEARRHWSAVPR